MNVENATSDDSVVIDEDLVAALGFEPAADILIVDDAANDGLSISSDDIRVTTESSDSTKADVKPTSPLGSGPPGHKNNRSKSKNKSKPKIHKAKPIKLEDRLAAESKAETDKAAAAKTKAADKPDSTGGSGAKAETKPSGSASAKADVKPKPQPKAGANNKSTPQAKSTGTKATDSKATDSKATSRNKKSDSQVEAKMPPPPVAANAVLLSEPTTRDYSFSDLEMPDIKGALARFMRKAPTGDAGTNTDTAKVTPATATDLAPQAVTGTVIDTRISDAPAIVTSPPPASVAPVTSPPVAPQPQIVEAPTEPNVYLAPKRSGRTRIRSRKVRRQIRHIDPWSVLTFSVIFHACVFGALLLASILVWGFADGAGVIENVEKLWGELADKPDFAIDEKVLIRAAAMIAGLMAIASSVLLVLLTVFFNLISDLVGGIRVTVIEEEPIRSIK